MYSWISIALMITYRLPFYNLGDLPGGGMTIIDGTVRSERSCNTPPATTLPEVM